MKQNFQWGDRSVEARLLSRQPLELELQWPDGRKERINPDIQGQELRLPDRVLPFAVTRQGNEIWLSLGSHTFVLRRVAGSRGQAHDLGGGFAAPMPGRIVKWAVEEGAPVTAGTVLLVMEAMKMEHRIEAPCPGRVTSFHAAPGDLVELGFHLLDFVEDKPVLDSASPAPA
jgi:acetyl/propionyl-CoA carboxylase alpha subunit